jgi:DNA-binding XRE family transcriptional regulator
VAAAPARAPTERELVFNRLPLLRASLHLALRIARYFDLPVEAVFSTEPFGPLGADALITRPAAAPEPQEPRNA